MYWFLKVYAYETGTGAAYVKSEFNWNVYINFKKLQKKFRSKNMFLMVWLWR